MSDKVQLIKEEIVRLYNLYELSNDYQRMGAFSTILDFIDSLPEEPASEDLEEEIEEEIDNLCELGCYMEDLAKGNSEGVYPLPDNVIKELRKFARHFAEWQKIEDEKLFKDDSWNYIEENYPNINQEEKLRLYDISIKSRLAGANAIKQKMMKDAVEGVIDIRKWPAKAQVEFYDRLPDFDVRTGDKVKIIIVKEEQQ